MFYKYLYNWNVIKLVKENLTISAIAKTASALFFKKGKSQVELGDF